MSFEIKKRAQNVTHVDEKAYRYLLDGGTRTPIFYILPKIHKRFEKIPPRRPIVSSVNSPTEKISQLIDIVLQPYAQSGESFILDTGDFLTKIKDLELNDEDWLFTMDVSSLYTNIPHHEGIKVVAETIKYRKGCPSNDYIIKMLSLVLKCNSFRMDSDHFLQINGTAMGTRVSPTYAIIYMNWFEKELVYNHPLKPRIWFRFIDDIWGIFRGSKLQLEFYP